MQVLLGCSRSRLSVDRANCRSLWCGLVLCCGVKFFEDQGVIYRLRACIRSSSAAVAPVGDFVQVLLLRKSLVTRVGDANSECQYPGSADEVMRFLLKCFVQETESLITRVEALTWSVSS